MTEELNYLAHIADDSERFHEVLSELAPTTRVPTCPDWTAADLVWHLGEVQWFWTQVILHRPAPQEELPAHPERPGSYEELLAFSDSSTAGLVTELDAASPGEPAWTWSRDKTVGFVYRRQAHEALIHRLDAELTARHRSPMDPALCSDGVDEVIRVMYGGAPDGLDITPDPAATVRFTAADTGGQWFATLARITGEHRGKPVDESTLVVADEDPGERAAASVTAIAEDLNCWLWGRPTRHQVDHSGDQGVLGRLGVMVRDGID